MQDLLLSRICISMLVEKCLLDTLARVPAALRPLISVTRLPHRPRAAAAVLPVPEVALATQGDAAPDREFAEAAPLADGALAVGPVLAVPARHVVDEVLVLAAVRADVDVLADVEVPGDVPGPDPAHLAVRREVGHQAVRARNARSCNQCSQSGALASADRGQS